MKPQFASYFLIPFLIVACQNDPATPKNSAAGADVSSEAAAVETAPKDASSQSPKTPADELAERVVAASGDPEALSELAFSFVPQKDGEEVSRRHHRWQPKAGVVTITADEKVYKLTHLKEYDLSKLSEDPAQNSEDWKTIAPDLDPADAAKAWGWFINDSYWLLMPTKLMDPGVNRAIDDQGRLVLTFGEVGLTPGDTYKLTIDPESARITRWEFKLQGGNEGDFDWKEYKEVGPLTLSTLRPARGANRAIAFDELEAKR